MNRSDVPQRTVAATSSSPSLGTGQTPEGRRLIQRIALLLGERTSLSRVMLIVLTAALIFGLIGFAARRDRGDAVNQRQEDELDTARRG